MSIEVILMNASVVSGLFPLVAASYNYHKLDRPLKLVAVFCLVSVILDFSGLLAMHLGVRNNLFLMHIFDIMAVLIFTGIYYYAFYEPLFKKIALGLCGIAFVTIISNLIFIEGIKGYPAISNTVLGVLLIILSLAYFYQLLTRQEFTYIEKQGLFWVNAGVLLYFSITVFLFMVFNKLSIASQNDYLMIQSITNIISNILFSVGLLCKPQKAA
jgi:ABC-type transport system involved in cytochrome c biogenesis permease subunit